MIVARNPNLVPTLITNVNGKKTTVYKKPQGASSVFAKVPAPALEAYDLSTSIISLLGERMPLGDRRRHDLRNDLRSQYSIESMKRIQEALQDEGDVGAAVASQLIDGTHGWLIDTALRYYPKLGIEDYDRVTRLVFSLSNYKGIRRSPSEYEEQGYINLMTLTHHLDNMTPDMENFDRAHPLEYNSHADNWSAATIKNKDLVRYVLENPQDMEALAQDIVKYGVTDPNAIIGIREGIVPVLADGAL